jgi:hypothetical protein
LASPPPSALRVWLPSRRFPPRRPQPVVFRPAALMGSRPSELSPSRRCHGVSAALTHASSTSACSPPGRTPSTAYGQPDLWALLRRGVPRVRPGCLAPAGAGCSLGLSPF